MAVHQGKDIVSTKICSSGWWEFTDVSAFGPPGFALDIGGNIGWYTFNLASAGWKVLTFEPMPKNLALMNATLCQNPHLASKIQILPVGLGPKPMMCDMWADLQNFGDGNPVCNDDDRKRLRGNTAIPKFPVGSFEVRRLDDVLAEKNITSVDFIKIDVEGYECQVLDGASSIWDKYRPRLIQSEVWGHMSGCQPSEYLHRFEAQGYTVTNSPDQAHAMQVGAPTGDHITDRWMHKGEWDEHGHQIHGQLLWVRPQVLNRTKHSKGKQ
eukprot:gnl/TRDRNA2_/TRDRNA2_169294_c0_seq1.p1 gnl/TRDRNA2_/TRDRNA2_169294_c0~~gnl/TRDRNA2_/TRDRNA2_169294_c0_seq1.p1  ORF type:complete len:291 (+),score=35.83 gnl/TRDRNA2_/TRDRNA2_169294_c0_seq1:71-874(+)